MQSYKHKATRPLIPSKEEAGMEDGNETVSRKSVAELPLNPVVTRGQDPELFWMHKYGPDDDQDTKEVDIRSLYRHEHISPELLINRLYRQEAVKPAAGDQLGLFAPDVRDLFGNTLDLDEFEKVGEYYKHQGDWSNRLIQGDSLLSMTSLLEREGFAGKVQMIYFDPPYGIKYGSNWQLQLHNRDVKDGADEHLSAEPEQIKAFRDTWELGIHSYLTYLRDRLLVARELLTDSGSCFVQINSENSHLVRCLMDEIFGSDNFIADIIFRKKSIPLGSATIEIMHDNIIFYAKNKVNLKYKHLYVENDVSMISQHGPYALYPSGEFEKIDVSNFRSPSHEKGTEYYRLFSLMAPSFSQSGVYKFEFQGKTYDAPSKGAWVVDKDKLQKLANLGRLQQEGSNLSYRLFYSDFPYKKLTALWDNTGSASEKFYVVQTANEVIKRCLLMTTDPGDLVLDPTCGSGTTAYVAEQWGRRWITLDTSRIALNIAKTRLMTAVFPYYYLYSDVQVETTEKGGKIKKTIHKKQEANGEGSDIRQGFVYEEVPHITLKSLANDEPPETETLYDKPMVDKSRLRVAGPFTVETLQNYEPWTVDSLSRDLGEGRLTVDGGEQPGASGSFEERIFEHLKGTGVMNGDKNERAVFTRVERTGSPVLHAEGFYDSAAGERKAYLHIGPQFGTVSKQSVNEAVKECRSRGDADWLIILGSVSRATSPTRASHRKWAASRSPRCACTTTCCRKASRKKTGKRHPLSPSVSRM